MKRILLIITFVLVSFISIPAQTVNGKEIRNRDVVWSDFTGEVDPKSQWDAWTYWVTTYSYSRPVFEGNTVRVTLTVRLFLRADSWVKEGKKNPRLLKHEQGHYKIGRICANEIEETINSMTFDRNNYQKQIDTAYWEIIERYKALNKQYDVETNHHKNEEQQKIWDKKLNDLLNQN